MICVVVLSMVEQAAKPLPRPVRVSLFLVYILTTLVRIYTNFPEFYSCYRLGCWMPLLERFVQEEMERIIHESLYHF